MAQIYRFFIFLKLCKNKGHDKNIQSINKKISTDRETLSTLELVNRSVLVGKVGFRSNAISRVKK